MNTENPTKNISSNTKSKIVGTNKPIKNQLDIHGVEENTNMVNESAIEYGHEYTYSDYLKFQYEEMVELIRGKIHLMSPAPRVVHQVISGEFEGIIWKYLKGKKCRMFHAPIDVVLPIANKKRSKATTVVQPDICIICDTYIIEDKAIFGVPNWIIEILSPATAPKDRGVKFDVYEEAGVSEYWIVSPEYSTVEIFLLENGKYIRKHVLDKTNKINPFTLPDLEIDLAEVFVS
jgi:Uma2 family endonuclease